MINFENSFADSIATETANNDLSSYLDEILTWYSQVGSDKSSQISNKLLKQLGEQELRLRIEKIIDTLFIGLPMVSERLFPLKMTEDQVKARYRKLIRVFHPDRGCSDQDWLNQRAEIINVAFKKYKSSKNVIKSQAAQEAPSSKKAPTVTLKTKPKKSISRSRVPLLSGFIRKHSGEHRRYQTLILISVSVVFLSVLGLGFLSTIEFDKPIVEIVDKEQTDSADYIVNEPSIGLVANANNSTELDQLMLEAPLDIVNSDLDNQFATIEEPESELEPFELIQEEEIVLSANSKALKLDMDFDGPVLNNIVTSEVVIEKSLEENISATEAFAKPFDDDQISALVKDNRSIETKKDSVLTVSSVKEATASKVKTASAEKNIRSNDNIAVSTQILSPKKEYSTVEAKELLNQYRRAYSLGDIDKIIDLYMAFGQRDKQFGQMQIEQYYRNVFSSTSSRIIALKPLLIDQKDNDNATIDAELNARMTSASKQLDWTDNKRFRLVLVRSNGKLRISSYKTL